VHLAVLGGGAIGVEFAQTLSRFGVRVTVIERGQRLLSGEEPQSGELLAEVLAAEGVKVHLGASVGAVAHHDGQFRVELTDEVVIADRLLVATGRSPVVQDLGLEVYGRENSGPLEVDGQMRVAEGLWAIGDVTGRGAFTHVAMYQARVAARDILGVAGPPADYRALPRVVFTDPEIGSAGLTEHQALTAGHAVRVGFTWLSASSRGWIHKVGNEGFIKIVEDSDSGVLLGATSVGPCGGEVLGALAVAIHASVPTRTLDGMIHAFPTFNRAIDLAVADLRPAAPAHM
jgi:pyruvate/2-oxoglutarate dehydrogenase complex dihydrolipoamide dehydrogenase (E3) component